ncbi:MAG: hypothetical protein M3040_14415, partial [Bacteroidota bacterium]|nr:hypothetical protein [Bacteroidota bacterium]
MHLNQHTHEYQSLYLKDYAHFVYENKLEDFVSAYLMKIHSFNIPLLTFFAHLPQQQLLASAREGIVKLLKGIEGEKAID